jgi:hypothetical protein
VTMLCTGLTNRFQYAPRPAIQQKTNASRPVSRVLSTWLSPCCVTIHLERLSPNASRNQPGQRVGKPWSREKPCCPYSVLLLVGFALPPLLPAARCALTAPFRPCRTEIRRFVFCGTIPEVSPAGRYPAPFFRGARTFLPRALSSLAAAVTQPTGKSWLGLEILGVK